MTDCPVTLMSCDRCDFRKVRAFDPFAKRMCEGCANYHGEEDE